MATMMTFICWAVVQLCGESSPFSSPSNFLASFHCFCSRYIRLGARAGVVSDAVEFLPLSFHSLNRTKTRPYPLLSLFPTLSKCLLSRTPTLALMPKDHKHRSMTTCKRSSAMVLQQSTTIQSILRQPITMEQMALMEQSKSQQRDHRLLRVTLSCTL